MCRQWVQRRLVSDTLRSAGFETDVPSLNVNKAAIEHLVTTSKQLGINSDFSASIQALIERRVAQGFGTHSLVEAFNQG